MTYLVGVQGTWSWQCGWWKDESPFWVFMALHGIAPSRLGGRPFRWSTDLSNTWQFWSKKKRHSDWEAGGDALCYYLSGVPEDKRVVLAHSHGGQCVAYAAAQGLYIHRLVTVATPVRADMRQVWDEAIKHIGAWRHVCDADGDKTAWWGAFGDGHFGNARTFNRPEVVNVLIKNIGHSKLLNDEDKFHLFVESGVTAFLTS